MGCSGSLVIKFFSLTFAVTWISFTIAGAVSGNSLALDGLSAALFLLGTIAPSLVALVLTARDEGREGAVALLRRILEWRVEARWYVFAVGYMVAIKTAVALVHRVATGIWPAFGQEAWYVIVGAIVVSTWAQAGEEIGWRGYALPRLAERWGFTRGSLLLGVIWACWHLPLFFIPGIDKFGQSFPVYALQVTALSVALAWLYANTRGSLLLVMLMHSAVNQTIGIVPSVVAVAGNPFAVHASLVAWLTAGVLSICAGFFLIHMPTSDRGTQASSDMSSISLNS